jgi:hypothetical protein
VTDDWELFTHTVQAWTAGQLRKALEGVPDEFPVQVFIAEEAGGDTCDEQVVFSAAPWNSRGEKDAAPDCFMIETEFPSGEHYRRRDDG